MPHFQPKHIVPVPAPTDPSATGPADAVRMAARTSAVVTGRLRMSFSPPSFVSPTSALTDRTCSLPGLRERVPDHRVDSDAHGQGVGQHDGRLDGAELVDLRRAGQLAEGVADVDRAGHLVLKEVAAVRKNRRHARADVVPANHRRVADADAWNIRDGVNGPAGSTPGVMPRSRARGLECPAGPATGSLTLLAPELPYSSASVSSTSSRKAGESEREHDSGRRPPPVDECPSARTSMAAPTDAAPGSDSTVRLLKGLEARRQPEVTGGGMSQSVQPPEPLRIAARSADRPGVRETRPGAGLSSTPTKALWALRR